MPVQQMIARATGRERSDGHGRIPTSASPLPVSSPNYIIVPFLQCYILAIVRELVCAA